LLVIMLRYADPTTVMMKIAVFREVTPCTLYKYTDPVASRLHGFIYVTTRASFFHLYT